MPIQERRLSFALCWLAGIICILLLGGCQTDQIGSTLKPQAICKALIGPISYNTAVKISRRYAGDLLAMDLKQRNQVGQRLGCPSYAR